MLAGAAGAVVAADAEVRAYTAAVAYLVAEKGGACGPPLFRMLGCACRDMATHQRKVYLAM